MSEETVHVETEPIDLDELTVAELREYAAAHAIDLGEAAKKADIRAAIDAASATQPSVDLSAAEPLAEAPEAEPTPEENVGEVPAPTRRKRTQAAKEEAGREPAAVQKGTGIVQGVGQMTTYSTENLSASVGGFGEVPAARFAVAGWVGPSQFAVPVNRIDEFIDLLNAIKADFS
jgi:hypothetical protein